MDLRKIKKLIELLEESALTELEIQEGEESIRLSRAQPLPTISSLTPVNTTTAPATAMGVTAPTMVIASAEAHAGITVASPMVGTFFAAPDADSPPYIEVGSAVSPGDTLCIIEAMKIFNHVEAEYGGRIAQIFKQSGDPVEFGEALFLIDEIQTDSPKP